MKLRNKKTGEIGYFCFANWDDPVLIIMDRNGVQLAKYNSLSELNADWEDYKEKGWYITENGEVRENRSIGIVEEESEYREIGNYFETREEAEKAVEKLKAWKRLKDKGFRFTFWDIRSGSGKDGHCEGEFVMFSECPDDIEKDDLDLLFSQEDD